jgi:hypothetical protein
MPPEEEEESILIKEIQLWKGFEYALRKLNATLFNEMLKEYLERMKNMLLHPKSKGHSILQSHCLWL